MFKEVDLETKTEEGSEYELSEEEDPYKREQVKDYLCFQ